VSLQLAARDSAAPEALIEELAGDVQRALNEAARLAQCIYPPLLETGGLAATLRAAAAAAGIEASVDVAAAGPYPSEVAVTVYFCWLAALDSAANTRPTIAVRHEGEALKFEIVAGDGSVDRLRDRVEALGGRLTIRPEGAASRVSGSLPVAQ
jgi:signal transduction histidine kinase